MTQYTGKIFNMAHTTAKSRAIGPMYYKGKQILGMRKDKNNNYGK